MAGSPNSQAGDASEYSVFLVIALIVMICLAIWWALSPVLIYPAFVFDWVTLEILGLFTSLSPDQAGAKEYIENLFGGLYIASQDVSWENFKQVRLRAGAYSRFIYALGILAMLLYIVKRMPNDGFRRRYTLAKKGESFPYYQAKAWPNAAYTNTFDAHDRQQSIQPSRWPIEWIKDYDIDLINGSVDYLKTEAAFSEQLGPRWRGIEHADWHVRAVAAVCALHIEDMNKSLGLQGDLQKIWAYSKVPSKEATQVIQLLLEPGSKDAVTRLEEFATNCSPKARKVAQELLKKGSNDVRQLVDSLLASNIAQTRPIVDKVFENPKYVEQINKICANHHYVHTAIFRLMITARASVGLPSACLLWIKSVDRTLWYVLNTCGRRAHFVEVAGVIAHYNAERMFKDGVDVPIVSHAISALEEYFEHRRIQNSAELTED
ncbi:hypothetical protein ACQU0X_26655 [Pseudovibrio ascidiaceicola]|uniref:secretion/conjugation apparatus DotM-related subunit n=1 Tax=Pseudovibrio ascidiaceicola TaxID=285279 RepID=UPI003D364662